MLKTYIFNDANKNWIEEQSSLLYHDLCAFVDEERNIIYLWNGPKSSKERLQKGNELLNKLISNYPNINFQISTLNKKIPDYIQIRLDKMLSEIKHEDKKEYDKFSRLITLRLYFIFTLPALILPLISFLNLITSLAWTKAGTNFEVNSEMYEGWLSMSFFLIIFTIISYTVILVIGVVEIDYQKITYSIIGLVVSSGIAIYLQQGIFLFLFQDGSTGLIYYIKQSDILFFLTIIVFGIALYEIPNLIELINFIKEYRKFLL